MADWARTPIEIGHPGFTLTPLVFGPDSNRLVTTTAEAARNPELTILAFPTTMSRHRDLASLEVVFAALVTLENAGHKDAFLYADMVLGLLPEPERQKLETLLSRGTVEFKSNFAKHHQARGEAKTILKILKGRHLSVSEEVRERVISCTDEEQLDAWVTRALTAERAEDLFE